MTERRAFSVAVFARHQGRFLLIKHRRLGVYLPPGGELNDGETPLEAARRELQEETGLTGRFVDGLGVDGTPAGLLGYEEHQAGSKGLHMNFAFVADVDTDQVTPNQEFSEYQWVTDGAGLDCPRNVVELGRMALHGGGHRLVALARTWLKAFNSRDLDGLLALYSDSAVHVSPNLRARQPETGGRIAGKAALREWWGDSMRRLVGLRYEERHLTANGNRVFMEYERINPGEPSYLVAEVLVVDEDGHIGSSHVFQG